MGGLLYSMRLHQQCVARVFQASCNGLNRTLYNENNLGSQKAFLAQVLVLEHMLRVDLQETNRALHQACLSYKGDGHSHFQHCSNFPTPGPAFFFSFVQTSLSQGQHLCSKFAKIPFLGCAQTFKVPSSSCGPPLGHNIDRCTTSER